MHNKKIINSKLFQLKEWLTVPESAKYLSLILGEDVTDADVIRLCLDGHLTLSVNFVNHAYARRGEAFLSPEEWEKKISKLISWETANFTVNRQKLIIIYFVGVDAMFYQKDDELVNKGPWAAFGPDERLKNSFLSKLSMDKQNEVLEILIEQAVLFAKEQSEKFHGRVPPSIHSFKGSVITIEGVWDLPMLGAEKLDVEHEYQNLTQGPEVTLVTLDGAFVEDEDGVIWQLQDQFDKEFIDGLESEEYKKKNLEGYAELLKKRISNNEIDEKEAEGLLDKQKRFLERPRDDDHHYYPAGGLPDDSVLVVRTRSLTDLQERLSCNDSATKKPLGGRAETTYLNIIGALLEVLSGDSPGIQKHPDFISEAKLIEHFSGFNISGLSKTTLELKFASAKRSIKSAM